MVQCKSKKREEFYIGATRATNNTAEKQGVIEALFWLNSFVERGTQQPDADVLCTVDSRHVEGLIEEKFTARENRVLATLLGQKWKATRKESDSTFAGYVVTRAMWNTASLIAWQTRAHAGSSSTDGGDGAHCVDGMRRASSRKL